MDFFMPEIVLLDTTFICPYMKITLEGTCSLETCPYYTPVVKSGCIWEYASSKNSISVVELSIILRRDKKEILNIIKRAKLKMIKTAVKQKLVAKTPNIKYCYKCGKAYNLRKGGMDKYVCDDTCVDIKMRVPIEKTYNRPISCILALLPTIMNLSMIAKLFKTSNKLTRQLYMAIFGDSSLLIRDRDLKESEFKRRIKRLKIRKTFDKRARDFSFTDIDKKIENLF